MALNLKIYNKNTAKEYSDLLIKKNINLDIYYYPEFLNSDAIIQNGEYEIIVIDNEETYFIYPYIKSQLPFKALTDYYDITSPYGYAGPYINSTDLEVINLFEEKLVEYFSNSNIVCEFVRYHYLYNKNFRFNISTSNFLNRNIVVLNLSKGIDYIWENEFSSKCRNLYRKMEKENYEFSFTNNSEDLEQFHKLYLDTMKNANADDFYFFELNTIQKMKEELGNDMQLCKVTKDNVVFGAALFFIKNKIVTYYLSARNLDYSKVNANNYLLAKVIQWASSQGNLIFNLGGGDDSNENNSLLSFKKNFSTNLESFFIGKRIFNTLLYSQIIEEYQKIYGTESYLKKKHILQFYR